MVSIVEKHNVDESMNHELVHILYLSVVRQEIDASAKSVRRRTENGCLTEEKAILQGGLTKWYDESGIRTHALSDQITTC